MKKKKKVQKKEWVKPSLNILKDKYINGGGGTGTEATAYAPGTTAS